MIEVVHIVARVTTDMTRFNAGMASMEAKAQSATAKMSLAGMRMTKYLTLPIAGIAYGAIKTATSFQKSMTMIQTQAGASAKDIPKITKAINDMSGKSVIQGPKDLADAYYHLQSVFGNTQKGAETVAQKMRILQNVAQLSQIGGSNIEDTTSAVAGIMRTRIKGAKDVLQVVKTINGIVGSGNMRMPQFVSSTGTAVLQTAKLAGLSLKEVGAAEAVFVDENMNANQAMTRFRTGLMKLQAPSKAGEAALEAFGTTSLKVGELMRSKGLGAALDDLKARYAAFVKEHGGGAKAKTMAFADFSNAFGGSRTASTIMTLVNQAGVYGQKYGQITAKAASYNTDLADSNKTLSVQFEKAWARIQVALQKFGVAIAPVVLGFLNVLVKLANAFTNLPTPIQHFVAAVAIGLAALGPMLIMISSMIKIFGDIGGLLGIGGDVALGFGTILPLAVIAAVAALVYFALKSKKFRADLEKWGKAIQGFFKWLGEDVIGPFFYKLKNWFTEGGDASRWKTQIIPALKAVGHAFEVVGKAIAYAVGWWHKALGATGFMEKFGGKVQQFLDGPGTRYGPKNLNARQKLLTAMDQAQGHHNMKLYRQLKGEAYRKGYLHAPPVRQPHPHHPHPHPHHDRHLQSHHSAPLVHIGNMNVRHESDAEIVSGKIARKVYIP